MIVGLREKIQSALAAGYPRQTSTILPENVFADWPAPFPCGDPIRLSSSSQPAETEPAILVSLLRGARLPFLTPGPRKDAGHSKCRHYVFSLLCAHRDWGTIHRCKESSGRIFKQNARRSLRIRTTIAASHLLSASYPQTGPPRRRWRGFFGALPGTNWADQGFELLNGYNDGRTRRHPQNHRLRRVPVNYV